jgi:hypothetical protein
MKQILFFILAMSTFGGFAQTIFFSENMGTTGTGTVAIAANTFQNASPVAFSGNADTRVTSASSGYTGASGSRNIFFSSGNGGIERNFIIEGINTTTHSGISLQFGYWIDNTTAAMNVAYSTDGTDYTSLGNFTATASSTWQLSTALSGIPSTTNLRLRFRRPAGATYTMRLDDVRLTGNLIGGIPILNAPAVTNSFTYAAGSGPSASIMSSFTGADLTPASGNITVTAPSGYQVSSNGTDFFDSVDIGYTSGAITSNYHVRLKAGLSAAIYNQNIAISGGGASTVNVTVTGLVYTPFTINYANDLRSLENRDTAILQGFTFNNVTHNGSGYQQFTALNSAIETPNIDFSLYQLLEIKFSTATFGGSGSQKLVAEYTTDGFNYTVFGEALPTSSTTYLNSVFVLDVSAINTTGKIRFRFESGSNTVRFRDVEINNYTGISSLNQTSGEINYATAFAVSGNIIFGGITNAVGQGAGINSSIGMSFENTNPNTWSNSFSWKGLSYDADTANGFGDIYTGNIGPQYQDGAGNDVWFWSPGVYYYATRFVEGANTVYGGVNNSNVGGIWNGTTFGNGKLKIRTEVRASQDGATYNSLTLPINAVGAVGATSYTFEFVNGANTHFVTSLTPATNFSALGANAVNGAWTIRVRADLNGGETIEYGAARTITLNNTVGLPQLRPSQCGLVVAANNGSVRLNAVPVSGASMYEFGVTVNGGAEQTVSSMTPTFNFGQLPNGVPGFSSTIAIRVRAQSSGLWTGWGSSCNVTTPTQLTRVRASQCNRTFPNLGSTTINANPVAGATAYKFGVTVNGGAEQILSLPTSFFRYSDLPSLPGIGATIAIRVRAIVNGIEGAFGLSCNVFTPAPADEDFSQNLSSNEEMTAYPNPFTNQFTLKLVSNSEASIQIFDINGRLVANQVVNESYDVELGQNLTSGVYLVRVEQNNETKSFKMIKK